MSAGALALEEPVLADEEAAEGERKTLKVLLIILVVVAVAAAATWWFVLRSPAEAMPAQDGEVVVLDPLTTTMGESSLRHARVNLAVVLAEGEEVEVVGTKAPILQDALLREIAQMDADELRSSSGSEALRVRLSEQAREIWGEEVVRRVLITELLVQ